MGIVPCVIVNKGSSVSHACNLITIIPPRHYSCIFFGILPQPIVSFAKIVQYIPRTSKDIIQFYLINSTWPISFSQYEPTILFISILNLPIWSI